MMNLFFKLFILNILASTAALAATEFTLKTPRGTEVQVILHRSTSLQSRAILVLAPGQSCNYKNNLFERFGAESETSNIAVIRFEWSYCSHANAEDRVPSQDLSFEREDFQTVLTFAQSFSYSDTQRIIVGGKSLGSVVAYQIFTRNNTLHSLLMLTPVCTYTKDAGPNPLPKPIEVGEENYPGISNEYRPILMALGDQDPLCLTPYLYDFLKTTKGNVSTLIGIGDHRFQSKNKQNVVDEQQTAKNISAILPPIFNWLQFQSQR